MLNRLFRASASYSHALLTDVLVRSLRGSVLIMGTIALLSSTSLWQFFASSFAGHDVQRAAVYAAPPTTDVVMVGIDSTGYTNFFGGRSPLNRQSLAQLFEAIEQGASQAHTLVVDLDLSPVAGESSDALDDFFHRTKGSRWLLADPSLADTKNTPQSHQNWRSRWCQAGVRFAYPYLPTVFGQVLASHQFQGAFSQAALRTDFDCEQRAKYHANLPSVDGLVQLQRVAAPMSAAFMRDGIVIPFQGDLDILKSMLESLQPKVVVVGGMWGNDDVFLTPFGERHGAHLHAAAIAGKLTQVRIAPLLVQMLAAWWVVSLIAQLLALIYQPLWRRVMPWAESQPGHQFLLRRVWPLSMMAITLLCLFFVSEASAWLLAHTGWWIPTAAVAATVIGSVLFVWNWGLNEAVLLSSQRKVFRSVVIAPVLQDWHGMCKAGRQLWKGSSPAATHPPPAIDSVEAMSRSRALLEFLFAGVSLSTQTLLPFLTISLAVTHTL